MKTNQTAIQTLLSVCKKQEASISKLLIAIGESGHKAVQYVKKANKPSIIDEHLGKKNTNEYFVEALRQIGKPASSLEISKQLKTINPHFEALSKKKKIFMQLVYSCASHLSKDKTIKRLKVGKGSYEYALNDFAAKNKISLDVSKTETEVAKDKKTSKEYFIEVLTQIGHPVTTSEIATRLRKLNPQFKNLSKNKKSFMQLIYSNASSLSKEGIVDKKPISGKSFEYGLPAWKQQVAA
jgi:hypothetical protein